MVVPVWSAHGRERPGYRPEASERAEVAIESHVAELRLLLIRTTGIAAEALQALLEEHGALGSAIEQRRGTRLVRLQAYFPIETEVPVAWAKEKLTELHANGVPIGPAEVRLLPLRGRTGPNRGSNTSTPFKSLPG